MRLLLEVIACSVEDAVEAERGGAGRIEIVRDLHRGGLTPDPALVAAIRQRTRLPLRVMIRERDGYEAGGSADVEHLQILAQQIAALRVDGLVLGFLRSGAIDEATLDVVIQAGGDVPITFHHAFDDLPDAAAALRALGRWPRIDRVLTGGGRGDWPGRAERLASCARLAGTRIRVLVGGGVNEEALRRLSRTPGIHEAHVGRAARVPPDAGGVVDHRRVEALIQAME